LGIEGLELGNIGARRKLKQDEGAVALPTELKTSKKRYFNGFHVELTRPTARFSWNFSR
jgi:hypothetical protein